MIKAMTIMKGAFSLRKDSILLRFELRIARERV